MRRGQLSLSLIEAGIGVLFVFAVVAGFALVPADGGQQRQLDRHARDVATLLAEGGVGGTPLGEAVETSRALARNRDALQDRVDALTADSFGVRVVTPGGTVGPEPPGRVVGSATVATDAGPVTVRVWYW